LSVFDQGKRNGASNLEAVGLGQGEKLVGVYDYSMVEDLIRV
jgi:hypothetical protein